MFILAVQNITRGVTVEYDKSYNYGKILSKYIDSNNQLLPLSQYNLNYIREYNQLLSRNAMLARKFSFIQKFVSYSKVLDYEDIQRYSHNIFSILSSLSKQRNFIYVVRKKLLEYRIDNVTLLNALKYNIHRLEQRLDYLENEILCSYLQFTEFYSYVLYLESNKLSFSSDLEFYIPNTDDIEDKNEKINVLEKSCLCYLDYINNFMKEHNLLDESSKRREKYKIFLDKKYKSFEKDKEALEKEKLNYCEYELDVFIRNIFESINEGNKNNFMSEKKFEFFRSKLNSFYNKNKKPFYMIFYTILKNDDKVLNLGVYNLNGYGASDLTSLYFFPDKESYQIAIERLSKQKLCKYAILEIYPEDGYLLAH